jgi:rubredoxin
MSDNREIKNSVFTPAQTHDSRIPSMSQADVVKAEFGLDIPTELVPLPSNGKVYPPSSSLHGKDMVEIRPMTAREEDILTSRALLKKGTVVTELIKSCLVDKSINTLDLVAGDRNALMVAVRITGYGAEYTAEVSCPECEAKSQQTFNLAELPVKRLEIDPVTEGQNLFEFVLPHTKKKVLFKFTTGKDEEELTVIQEKQKKLGLKTDSTVTTALQQAIVSVDGIEDRAKINNFIKAMPARDSLALRNHIRQNEPGLTMKQDMTCPECGHSEEVNMPLGVSFLWPTS